MLNVSLFYIKVITALFIFINEIDNINNKYELNCKTLLKPIKMALPSFL